MSYFKKLLLTITAFIFVLPLQALESDTWPKMETITTLTHIHGFSYEMEPFSRGSFNGGGNRSGRGGGGRRR